MTNDPAPAESDDSASDSGSNEEDSSPPKKTSNVLKWVLIIVVGSFLLCFVIPCTVGIVIGIMTPRATFSETIAKLPNMNKSVDDFEKDIPLLKDTGHSTTDTDGVATFTWTNMTLADTSETTIMYGPKENLKQIVLKTKIYEVDDTGKKLSSTDLLDKIKRYAGVVMAFSLVQKLDPSVPASQMEGFFKWCAYASNADSDYGNVQVHLDRKGSDERGENIEFRLRMIK